MGLKSMAPRVEVPCAASPGPLRRESRSLGTKLKPKSFEFGAFMDPSGQNQLYHTPLLSKIWDLNDRKKLVNNPFNRFHHHIWHSSNSDRSGGWGEGGERGNWRSHTLGLFSNLQQLTFLVCFRSVSDFEHPPRHQLTNTILIFALEAAWVDQAWVKATWQVSVGMRAARCTVEQILSTFLGRFYDLPQSFVSLKCDAFWQIGWKICWANCPSWNEGNFLHRLSRWGPSQKRGIFWEFEGLLCHLYLSFVFVICIWWLPPVWEEPACGVTWPVASRDRASEDCDWASEVKSSCTKTTAMTRTRTSIARIANAPSFTLYWKVPMIVEVVIRAVQCLSE